MKHTVEKLLSMELHEELKVHDHLRILRVSGGWIYNQAHSRGQFSPSYYTATFVPVPGLEPRLPNYER